MKSFQRALGCAVALVAASLATDATALSCEQFKTRLVQSIHDGGDLIRPATDYRIVEKDSIWTIEEFAGISDLRGRLYCNSGGELSMVSFSAYLINIDDTDVKVRSARLQLFIVAGLCAIERLTQNECLNFVEKLQHRSTETFLRNRLRGDDHPQGKESAQAGGAKVEILLSPGLLSASITLPPADL
jgi:hypothetical protein